MQFIRNMIAKIKSWFTVDNGAKAVSLVTKASVGLSTYYIGKAIIAKYAVSTTFGYIASYAAGAAIAVTATVGVTCLIALTVCIWMARKAYMQVCEEQVAAV